MEAGTGDTAGARRRSSQPQEEMGVAWPEWLWVVEGRVGLTGGAGERGRHRGWRRPSLLCDQR